MMVPAVLLVSAAIVNLLVALIVAAPLPSYGRTANTIGVVLGTCMAIVSAAVLVQVTSS